MRVRNPKEPTTYLTAKSKDGKHRSRSLAVYGITPQQAIEVVERAFREAAAESNRDRQAVAN